MARKLRIQYAGAVYHIMDRGDHQENIFRSDEDRHLFLAALEEVCQKTSWQVHAFCLMSNHFHLVVETPSPNLVEGMKWFSGFTRGASRPPFQSCSGNPLAQRDNCDGGLACPTP